MNVACHNTATFSLMETTFYINKHYCTGAHRERFLGSGGAYPEPIYNLCLILKVVL
jgi:hypothetical protein